jgi:hypothetical protein
MDHCFPFGAKNAHNCLGITVDAIIDILRVVKISPIPKWADDLFPIRFAILSSILHDGSISYHYFYDLSTLKDTVAPLCIPWHPTKWNDFSSTPVYLGLVWNFENHSVSLAEPKQLKYLTKVSNFLHDHSSSRIFKKRALSILGTLSHITIVHQDGCSYLSALTTFISTFTSVHIPQYLKSAVLKDLEWWVSKLSQPCVSHSPVHREDIRDLGISIDVSTSWGIGVVIDTQWDAWLWRALWHFDERNIRWAEAVAVKLVARILLEQGLANTVVLIRGDNQGVIGSFARGRGRNLHVNLAICCTDAIAASSNVLYMLDYIESDQNEADPISHGEFGPHTDQITNYVQLPKELQPFLEHV